jgi:uncharacterized protein
MAFQVDALLSSLEPQGYVSDFAGVMGATRAPTERLLAELEQKTGVQVAVVSLNSLDGGEAADFINRLFERWGVGGAEQDDGVMLLAAITDREVRIEVGYGLEPLITDARAGRILDDSVIPFFREDRYGDGLASGAAAIAAVIAEDAGVELTGTGAVRPEQPAAQTDDTGGPGIIGSILRFGFLLLLVLVFIRNPWLALLLLSSGRGGGHFRGGGGFGRGGGGGFGGFGGGMSGGGGAGRSW